MKIVIVLTIQILLGVVCASAQTVVSPLKIKGYVEMYYVYDFSNPASHTRPICFYSYNRHNEVSVNLGYLQAEYDKENVRGKLALMTGTYSSANLKSEPDVLRNIFEANLGLKLSNSKNVWIDAGVFSSHIGFESAVGANCWNMTRSLMAENSPYYESGVKLSYTSNDGKWFVSGLLLNGWQRMQRINGNNTPACGHQLTWMPDKRLTINSSSFVGSDSPDSLRKMRYFHNFYAICQVTESIGLILGVDVGAQQKSKNSALYDLWYSPVCIARYAASDKLSLATRAEFYSDKYGVIVSTGTVNGFQTLGLSLNMDLQLADNVMWRIESRMLRSLDDPIFVDNNQHLTASNIFTGTSLSVRF